MFLFFLYDLIFDDPIGFFRLRNAESKGIFEDVDAMALCAAGYLPFMYLELLHRQEPAY